MEGLLLAEALRPLLGRLPLERGSWRFPDERTAVLPLGGGAGALWIFSRPPSPRVALRPEAGPPGPPRGPFQQQLLARAVGPLEGVGQHRLDRVFELRFGPSGGFVPEPPVTLVAELTGRNANLVLLDERRTVLGVERPVSSARNRYRELQPGIPYRPPPPYDKLDPRRASAAELAAALHGRRLREVRGLLDGIGPELTTALAYAASVDAAERLEGAALERVVAAVPRLCEEPAAWVERAGGAPGLPEQRARGLREKARSVLREAARRRVELSERRLADAERALGRGGEAERLRREADLLTAYGTSLRAGARSASLPGFDGHVLEIELDPRLDAFGNARKRYQRARRFEERARRARRERPRLEREREEALQGLRSIDSLPDEELLSRAEGARKERRRPARSGPGVRFRDPHGFEVVVGRNARENEAVTFGLARSRDLWLHVQGFTGAHVVVRAESREVPFDTVLFAARLAAGFSPARQSDNVAVDYTLRKNVWKVKGQPPGAVSFSHHKTVFVTPARDPEAAAGAHAGPSGDGSRAGGEGPPGGRRGGG